MTLKSLKVIVTAQAIYHFRLVVCSNNISVLHRFRDFTTFTVYVTALKVVQFQ